MCPIDQYHLSQSLLSVLIFGNCSETVPEIDIGTMLKQLQARHNMSQLLPAETFEAFAFQVTMNKLPLSGVSMEDFKRAEVL